MNSVIKTATCLFMVILPYFGALSAQGNGLQYPVLQRYELHEDLSSIRENIKAELQMIPNAEKLKQVVASAANSITFMAFSNRILLLDVNLSQNETNKDGDKVGSNNPFKRLLSIKPAVVGAYLTFGLLVFILLFLYLRRTAKRVFESRIKLRFISQSILITALLLFITSRLEYQSIYAVPFVFIITVISYFFNTRIGLFVHLLSLIFAGLITGFDGEFMTITLIIGLIVVLIFNGNKSWKHVFGRFLGITLSYFVCFTLMELMKAGSLENLDKEVFYWMTLNGLLTMMTYPLIPVIARVYGFTSEQVLEELSDLNHPLLKEMAAKSPGTLQHSIQLSSLVGSVAEAINANAQLVRVGALYHDVGKTKYPESFIENLAGKENIHDSMNTIESASRIIDHVREGEKLAKKYQLPQEITNFVLTHHGTSRVEYFYRKHKAAYPESTLDEKLFRYPGPVPGTKEEAILMLADSLEASARSISNLQSSQVDELVDKIIRIKLQDRQLDECGLSVKELETCSVVFKTIIKSMHHLRVQYPDEE